MKKLIFTAVVLLFSFASFAQMHSKFTNVTRYGGHDGTITLDIRGGTPPYAYNWNNGSDNDKLTNLCSGVYTCSITDQHGCTYTVDFNITEPRMEGYNNNNNRCGRFTSNIQVYPNPSAGHVHVKFSSEPNTGFKVRIVDISGRTISEKTFVKFSGNYEDEFDLTQQPKGMYFIQVNSDEEVMNQKLLVN